MQTNPPHPTFKRITLITFAVMLTAWALATYLIPTQTWYAHLGSPDYEQIIPKSFGEWQMLDNGDVDLIVNPEQANVLSEIYSQIISRIYVHKPSGRKILLSASYGDTQLRKKQLHRPDSCYSSQGFKISTVQDHEIQVNNNPVHLYQFYGDMGARREYVSYFIRIGNKVLDGPPQQLNLTRMALGLKGYIADGLLFRISEITTDKDETYKLQDQFIQDLMKAVPQEKVNTFLGSHELQ